MERRKPRGITAKLIGEEFLISEIIDAIDVVCEIVHIGRTIHSDDGGSHVFIQISGVKYD